MKARNFKCRMCGACCRINPVKPDKCRTFPFEWTNLDSTSVCPGLAEVQRTQKRKERIDKIKKLMMALGCVAMAVIGAVLEDSFLEDFFN